MTGNPSKFLKMYGKRAKKMPKTLSSGTVGQTFAVTEKPLFLSPLLKPRHIQTQSNQYLMVFM